MKEIIVKYVSVIFLDSIRDLIIVGCNSFIEGYLEPFLYDSVYDGSWDGVELENVRFTIRLIVQITKYKFFHYLVSFLNYKDSNRPQTYFQRLRVNMVLLKCHCEFSPLNQDQVK